MRYFTKLVSLGLVGTCIVIVSGCFSHRFNNAEADKVFNQLVKQVVLPVGQLAGTSITFWQPNKRWPKDYEELSAFANQSGGSVQFTQRHYDRIDFTSKPDGSLEIYAAANGLTNQVTLIYHDPDQK